MISLNVKLGLFLNLFKNINIFINKDLNMTTPKTFTFDKIELLKKTYSKLPKKEVLKYFPEYKWRSLQNIANSLKIKREICPQRRGNIENLFNNSFESYYWLGLIAADGTISNNGTLKIDLSIHDIDYLKNLAKFLNTTISVFPPYNSVNSKKSDGICRVKIKDLKYGLKLRDLFKINGLKTYNPINIDFISEKDFLMSFVGGLIDGDGNISKRGYIFIDMHKNYFNFLNELGEKLKNYQLIDDFNVFIYKDMCRISFNSKSSLLMKNHLKSLNLPIMERKWSRISDIPKIKNYLLFHKDEIIKLRKNGKKLNEICDIINYKSIGTLSSFIKNHI